jgi:hypothetical protein
MRLEVNNIPLLTHTWTRCEVWREIVTIPGSMIQAGQNDLQMYTTHSTRPSEREPGNCDMRQLSVGFSRLSIQRK